MSKAVAAALVLALFIFGCTEGIQASNFGKASQEYGSAKVTLPDGFVVNCEVPKTQAGIERGLIGRTDLCESCGMLFIFDYDGRHGFWMRNMSMDIDIVYIDREWRVVGIAQDVPPCYAEECIVYVPGSDSRYVLELPANATARHGLSLGSKIVFSG